MTEKNLVLFVCLHASAKSLIAAEYFNELAAARGLSLRAVSAGTEPDPVVPPHVVKGLLEDGFDVRGRIPQRLTKDVASPVRIAVTFEPALDAFVRPDCPVERWTVPHVSDGYGPARDAIRERVEGLLARLTG